MKEGEEQGWRARRRKTPAEPEGVPPRGGGRAPAGRGAAGGEGIPVRPKSIKKGVSLPGRGTRIRAAGSGATGRGGQAEEATAAVGVPRSRRYAGTAESSPATPAPRTLRRVKHRSRIRFTRRFYALLGVAGGIVLLLMIVTAAKSCGGDGKEFQALVQAGMPLKEGDLHRMKVNELGAVMILEYHRIAEEGRWSRTPENFRSDLEYLYEQGYRCIRLQDLVTNNIDVEAGYTPVVITFDDADPSQFRYVEEGGELKIDPRCAVGVMEQFAAEHPDFNMTATFFVLPVLFGQEEYKEMKLRYLVEHGYDIGNHTMNHVPLGEADEGKILEELAGNMKLVRKYLPDYRQTSLALPLGSEPKDYSVLKYGEYEGVEIDFLASLLVGANPAPAPCDRYFDPLRLPRIQALDPSLDTGDSGIYAWIQYFMENPERRYVSDGDPSTVTIPKHMEERIDREKLGDKRLRLY